MIKAISSDLLCRVDESDFLRTVYTSNNPIKSKIFHHECFVEKHYLDIS